MNQKLKVIIIIISGMIIFTLGFVLGKITSTTKGKNEIVGYYISTRATDRVLSLNEDNTFTYTFNGIKGTYKVNGDKIELTYILSTPKVVKKGETYVEENEEKEVTDEAQITKGGLIYNTMFFEKK